MLTKIKQILNDLKSTVRAEQQQHGVTAATYNIRVGLEKNTTSRISEGATDICYLQGRR